MKGGVGGPCCHCGATSSPCWRKGPSEKPILCNACGARYLVKRSLDGYMPGQKPSKFATTSPMCVAPGDVQQRPGPKRPGGDGSSRKRRVVDRYEIEDLYHFTSTTTSKRARGRSGAPQPAPVSINVTAGLGGLMQTSISLWKPAEVGCAAFGTGVRSGSVDAAPSLKSFFSYPASKAHLQMDSEAAVLASALALLRQAEGSTSSGSSSCCNNRSSISRSPSPAADDFPRRRRKQQHPTAGAAS